MNGGMIHAYASPEKGASLVPFEYEPDALGPHDVRLRITHCGICHSDIHLIDDDWEVSKYPLVPGHEIVGIVEEKGDLSTHEIGDRVGIGWQGKSCFHCEWCNQGDENLCLEQEPTCVEHYGGFADSIVADGRFAFLIPEALPSLFAAPLLCGGATVFSPFIEHQIGPLTRVAVIGIGGLGHLALQFARAHNCDVTAISSSSDKEKEAKGFGANHFVKLSDLENHTNAFDFIFCTSSRGIEWKQAVSCLRPRGKLCLIGVPTDPLELPVGMLVDGRKIVCGSNIGSRPVIEKMLAFSARNKVRPQIEEYPMSQVNEAIGKVRSGKMRYRAVLFQ